MKPKDLLMGRMEDLADRALKTGCAASRFLSPAEARDTAARFARGHGVTLCLDGGYEGAERVRAIFINPDWGVYERAAWFAALKIDYRRQDTLGHRDVLGALMAMGVERATLGDILADKPPAVLLCLPEFRGYLMENLTQIGRIGVHVSEMDIQEVPARIEKLAIRTDTVASLRLDAVLCAAFDVSRAKSAELIAAGRVYLDHELCLQPAGELCEGCLLTVRGLGRARLLSIGGTSRKGRLFVQIGLYGGSFVF